MAEVAPEISAAHATFLGFDFGEKKTGVAVGQRITGTARALETLRSETPEALWGGIGRLVEAWEPSAFVVGLPFPIVETSEKNPVIDLIKTFCRELESRFQRPVHIMDEALSTRESQTLFFAKNRRKSVDFRDVKDQIAAQLILQTWLDHTAPRGSLDD